MAGLDARYRLPDSWVWAPLQDLCEVIQGQSPPGDTYNTRGEGLPFFQGKAEFGELHPVAVKWCTAPKKIALPGDVLISIRAPVGPTNLCSVECCIGRGLAACRPADGIDSRYLLYALRDSQARLAELGTGSTFDAITGSDLRSHDIPVGPSPEQRRIVAEIEKQFTRLDAGVAALQRVRASLGRYQTSMLKAAREGRLVPTEAELARKEGREYEPADQLLRRILEHRRAGWAAEQGQKRKGKGRDSEVILKGYHEPPVLDSKGMSELPEGWAWASVEMVGDVLLGRQRAPQYLTGRFTRPYLRVANVKDDALDLRDVERMDFDEAHFAKYRLIPGDILVSEGQSPELVGQSAIFRGGIENLCFQKTLHRFRPMPEGPSSEFAQLVFRTHVKSGVFRRVASITTNIAHLTLEKFKAAPFPLPPRAEQLRIVAEIERRLSIVAKLEGVVRTNLEWAIRLRQAILKRAFEGGLAARDLNDEPASALLKRIRASRTSVPSLKRPGSPAENKSPIAAERAP